MSHRIAFVVAPGFELLDLAGPLCAFNLAKKLHGADYEIAVVSATGGMVEGSAGLPVDTSSPRAADEAHTVIAIGGPMAHVPQHSVQTVACLASVSVRRSRIASVCTGAFFLAEAGILDGRRATTHWRWAPLLQSRFPQIAVEADSIFINDRDVWTSAGITAGIDMALALIEVDQGPDFARRIARDMVVYHRRPGGQSQFSAILDMEPASDRIRAALTYARGHLTEGLSVERLAEAACMSVRQFSRLFVMETGETPARAVERLRVEVARPSVEDSNRPFDTLAREAGFGDSERMCRSFIRVLGLSPQELRRISRRRAQ
ncbi:TPA: GlxA family transcriptional regulator [Pseudomonas aeruginosa]